MWSIAGTAFAAIMLLPCALAAQTPGTRRPSTGADQARPRSFTVQAAAGATLQGAGTLQSASFGFSPSPRLTLLVGAERLHLPTEVRYYEHGRGATRGGTMQFVTVEARFALRYDDRISPYAVAGFGRGISRANVNEIFPDDVSSNGAGVAFAGGGVRVPLRRSVDFFAEARCALHGEQDVAVLLLPVRAGVAWRF